MTLPPWSGEGSCAYRDMRLSWVLTVLSICLSALGTATGAEGKRKLQIGVKKRVDHCPIKSRKGDVLHMHYTVGIRVEVLGLCQSLETRKDWESCSSLNQIDDLEHIPLWPPF